jgi:hypothetical protein
MLEIKEYAFNFILSTRVQPSKSLFRSREKDLEGRRANFASDKPRRGGRDGVKGAKSPIIRLMNHI